MRTDPGIADPDVFYATLVAAQEGMTAAESAAFNARLVLLLANQIGDFATLLACIDAAKHSAD